MEIKAYDRVKTARSGGRPMGKYYIDNMIEDFCELHGDRRYGDDGAIIGGVGFLGGKPVTVIAMERGETVEDRMARHFGCPAPEGYRKALRLMKQAEKFGRPIICFIGSPGAYCGIEAENRGQGEAIAENLFEMMGISVPIISVVAGEGGSGGALALGVCDSLIMLENAIYSVISPEGCASILWKDSAKAPDAAEALRLTAPDLYKFGIADKIIDETDKTNEKICKDLKDYIVAQIELCEKYSAQELLDKRYGKFRKIK
ncbi:MAG: acetyl-CoA carboxylase carboxyl transferase subunit alpha [Clostridia bacterium]|nr:acetyl-CoA carboxylase carboxyl transferase subunit alpha [Clostridia bacterium]